MSRYKIIVQYDGTGFRGWQLQKNERTIQGELESALSRINKHKEIRVHGAGRTDTGVHATGQVAHFDLHTDSRGSLFEAVRTALIPSRDPRLDIGLNLLRRGASGIGTHSTFN